MNRQGWILSPLEQAEMGISPPPCLTLSETPTTEPYIRPQQVEVEPVMLGRHQFSMVQQELFTLDPQNHDFRQSYFEHLPRQLSDYFGKLYKQRLTRYGSQWAGRWFKQQMDEILPRFELVIGQYADVFSLFSQPWQDLTFLDEVEADIDPLGVEFHPHDSDYLKAERQMRINKRTFFTYAFTRTEEAQRIHDRKRSILQKNLQPLCYQRPQQIEQMATAIAYDMGQQQEIFIKQNMHRATDSNSAKAVLNELYCEQIKRCEQYKINAPYTKKGRKGRLDEDKIEIGLLKLACPKFWHNKLKQCAIRMKEHLAIAVGMVSLASGGYVSNQRLSDFEVQRKANYNFIKNCIITNLLDDEEQAELLDIWLKSSGNPKIRRIELMTRMNGFDQLAEHYGDEGLFITFTAPSKFHAMRQEGGINPKWNGSAPNQTQQYLCGQWAKIRAELNREKIKVYGFRVAEPHHDGTPHWHLILYTRPEHIAKLKAVFLHYALEEDGTERGAKEHRCTFTTIDRSKGSGASYLAKYISKGIDGYGMDGLTDDETGNEARLSAKRVQCWASTWRIRQFQQIGGASVSVWREARRLGDQVQADKIVDDLRIAADVGCWASYTEFQGGALALRKDLKARLNYALYGKNRYGEERKKVNGIINQTTGTVTVTRLKEWVISRKPSNWDEIQQQQQRLLAPSEQAVTASQREAEIGGLVRPWTCVSNCTSIENKQISPAIRERIKNELIVMRGHVTEYQLDDLFNGKPLKIYSNNEIGIYARYSRGQLIEERIKKPSLN